MLLVRIGDALYKSACTSFPKDETSGHSAFLNSVIFLFVAEMEAGTMLNTFQVVKLVIFLPIMWLRRGPWRTKSEL
jgi:hypothetical protein